MPPILVAMFGSKWTWIAVGVVILITAAAFYISSVYSKGSAAGAAATTVVVQQKTIQTQQKMDKAQNAGPRTQSDVVKSLRAHTF